MHRLACRSSSLTSSRRALSALLSLRLPHHPPSPHSPSLSTSTFLPPPPAPSGVSEWRGIHSLSGGLGFRASEAVRAQYAVDERGADDEGLEIAKLPISPVIISELAKKGITKLFPIQRAVLEPAMQGRDMIGRAKTGTGKTLAFGIPIMDKIIQFNLKHGCGRNPLALVLAPTRELARQVEKEFRESSDLETICVYGGSPINQQMRALDYGVDVVVGTPGRVIDLLKRGALNLSEVQFLVLDEADQMLAVGFAEAVEIILERLPTKRQSMMFSATMPNWIRQVTRKYLNDPVVIDLVGDSDQKLPKGVTLYSIASDAYGKAAIIGPLVTEHAKGGKCIVFTQTKRGADRLAYYLGSSLKCEPLHGDISQSQRERTLSAFRDGGFNVLVATDVAARGLDIPNVDLVIHYELPNNPEIFVHRSGRTGRAGKKGSTIAIYTQYETRDIRMIEQHVGCRFEELPSIKVEGGAPDPMHPMFGDFGRSNSPGRSRFDSWGKPSFNRGGNYGQSGFGWSGSSGSSGRSGGYGGRTSERSGFFATHSNNSRFSRSGGFGSSFDRRGGFGDLPSGQSDFFGGSGSRTVNRSGGFGFGRSGGSGGSLRSGGFSDLGHSKGSASSGHSSVLDEFGRSGGSGNSNSQSGSFDSSSSSGSGGCARFRFDVPDNSSVF